MDDDFQHIHDDCTDGFCDHCDYPIWRCLCIPICPGH